MTVRCVELKNSLGTQVSDSPWLSKEKLYEVVTIIVEPRRILVRILADDSYTPAIFDLSLFHIVNGAIPANWTVNYKDGILTFGPAAWSAEGFWERYFDGDSSASPGLSAGVVSNLDSNGGASTALLLNTNFPAPVTYNGVTDAPGLLGEIPLNGGDMSSLIFVPIFGAAGVIFSPAGTIGVYAGATYGGVGFYVNLGGGSPGQPSSN